MHTDPLPPLTVTVPPITVTVPPLTVTDGGLLKCDLEGGRGFGPVDVGPVAEEYEDAELKRVG